jgi:hypothetical protein
MTTGNSRIDGATAEIAVHVRDGRVGSHARYRDQDHYDEAMRLRDEILQGAGEQQEPSHMGPGSLSRASELVMEPRNQELKTARRIKLLTAFRSLDINTQADLLELVEHLTIGTAGGIGATRDARAILRQVYDVAGLGQ